MTDRIFDYIKENKEHLKLLFNHISTRHFTDQLIDQEKKLYCLTTNSPEQRGKNMVKMAFLISGYAGIILDYQFHGTPEISEKEVKKALMRYYSPLQEKNKTKDENHEKKYLDNHYLRWYCLQRLSATTK